METRKNIFNETEYKLRQSDLVNYIAKNPNQTEAEIQRGLWGYDRTTSMVSNKKYADILRRALKSKKIVRTQIKKNNRQIWHYTVNVI